MDPKTTRDTIVNGNGQGVWIEEAEIPGSGGKVGFALRKLYADGRVVIEYYERGKEGVVKTVDAPNDEDQQKRWDDFQKEKKEDADKAQRAQEREDTANRLGLAEERQQRNQDRLIANDERNAGLAQQREERASRAEDRAVAASERATTAQEQANQRGWAELALQQQREQRLSDAEAAKLRNGEVVRTTAGRYIQIRNGPDGRAVIEDVTPASTTRPGTAPTLPQGTHLGNISTAGQAVAQRIVDDPNMTPQEKINALDQLKGFLTTFTQETGQILGAQQNIYTNESNQRSLNVRDAESRRNFSAGLIQDAFKDVSSLKVPVGSNLGGPAFMSRVMMGLSLADKLGGLKVFPDVEMGTALQQTKGLGLPGMEQSSAPAAPSQVQSGGSGQPINIFNVSQPPQSVQAALPPVPGGGFLPAGNDAGLRFEGGQIRAPGFRADEDTPAWMDEMVGAY